MNNLRQQIVQERVEQVAKSLSVPDSQAFLRFVHSIITGRSLHNFDISDLVDGSQDKGIDAITIDQDGDEATVYIIQAKNMDSFQSNSLIQMRNGLDWISNRSRSEVGELSNVSFKDRIMDFRAIRGNIGPSNMHITAVYVTNGSSNQVSDECRQEAKAIVDSYDNGTYGSFRFEIWGCDELVLRINEIEKRNRKIDAEIRIRYDMNNPSLLKYHSEGLKGLVCTTNATEIARIVNDDSTGAIFDANIRRFLGTRGAVNSDIRKTCTQADSAYHFWFLNNGVTIICDSFDPVTDPDTPHVKVRGMQIVNGCQTATTLALAAREGYLRADARVLLRIYETSDSSLIDKIVETTNNQNKISTRDLRANDQIQIDMEVGFARYGYHYERKAHQYDNDKTINARRIVVNEDVGQSYLAIVLRKPADARRRKYKVWGDDYGKIFSGQIIEPHVLATLIYLCTSDWLRTVGYTNDRDDIRRKLAKNGAFHVARIAGCLWRGTDDWKVPSDSLRTLISALESSPQDLQLCLQDAFDRLEAVVRAKPQYAADLDSALKSGSLDSDIDKALHGLAVAARQPDSLWDSGHESV